MDLQLEKTKNDFKNNIGNSVSTAIDTKPTEKISHYSKFGKSENNLITNKQSQIISNFEKVETS